MFQEPFKYVPIEEWTDLQSVLLSDWPRSLPGFNLLESQARWRKEDFDHGIQVYCPYGDMKNGFVAIYEKASAYELIIQYPKDDTDILEKALRTTKVINWERPLTLPFASCHVISSMQKVIKDKNVEMNLLPSDTFIIQKDSPLFEDVSLPQGVTFDLLSSKHVDLIDSKWPHRYPSSSWYFQVLVDTKSGYGLFKNRELISWIFIGECGFLVHLYTIEEHRNQGYAELILKLISNELLKMKRQVFAFCVEGNVKAYNLYQKVGFEKTGKITWGFLKKKSYLKYDA